MVKNCISYLIATDKILRAYGKASSSRSSHILQLPLTPPLFIGADLSELCLWTKVSVAALIKTPNFGEIMVKIPRLQIRPI